VQIKVVYTDLACYHFFLRPKQAEEHHIAFMMLAPNNAETYRLHQIKLERKHLVKRELEKLAFWTKI
jgi:hypothetical protein